MTLRRKIKKARQAGDTNELARLQQRRQLRRQRAAKAGEVLFSLASALLSFFGIRLPAVHFQKNNSFTIKTDTMNANQFQGIVGFITEMIVRLFSGKPRFFVWAQRIAGLAAVLLAALKWVIDPATGFTLSPQASQAINYTITALVALIAAFQLPVNDNKTDQP
ncbi:MAG: hypothetical protein KatS3mg031_0192 [Chitinophagales bacterium]|nr:MAG: hypothetical protein KatS3mg031_0192 [Chitinophagales bacterium]